MRLLAVLALSCVAFTVATGTRAAAQEEEASAWLQAYLRHDTSNPPGREGPAAAYLASLLHQHGIATRRLVSPGGRTSLYARIEAPELM